jgi:hypothetical protein
MSDRLDGMVAELEAQFARAQEHEQKMRATLPESAHWSQPEDREWLVEAVAEAEQMTRDARDRLAQGRRIVARVQGLPARCTCGRLIGDPCLDCE